MTHAKGAKIWDVDGKEYIDYVGSWGPAILGHAPKVVVDAVREAATRGLSFGIPNPLEVEMAELICELDAVDRKSADGKQRHGSDHVVHSPRARVHRARQDHQVRRLLSRACRWAPSQNGQWRAHSRAALTARACRKAFADLTISLPFNDADLVRKAFAENKGKIAAIIVEPVPANAGLYLPSDDFLSILRNECTVNGALLIFDEVITGFRLARGGAQEIYGVKPDLTALGKVIGGGLPGRRVRRPGRNHGPAFT